jgi:hypothetical protein
LRGIVSSKVRWFAVATGCFTAIAGAFALGLGFTVVPIFLIVGALLQPRFPRTGRGLMCAGALWLSFWVFDIGILMLIESHPGNRFGAINLIIVVSVLLIAVCDWVIVIEEVKIRRGSSAGR